MIGMYMDVEHGKLKPFTVNHIYYDTKREETIFLGMRPSGHAIRLTASEISFPTAREDKPI